MNSFKFNASRVFLTYPQCTLSKEQLLESLQALYDIKEYIVALEAHQDGSPHLHAVLFFTRKVHRDNSRAFDVQGFHPNIQTIKNAADKDRVIAYVRKGGDFLQNLFEKHSKRDLLAQTILEEGLTHKVIRANPSIIFLNYSSIRSWVNFMALGEVDDSIIPSGGKKIHYWIHGPSNCGKTYWLRALLKTWNHAEIPSNNDYSTVTPHTNLLWFDEYRGSLTIQQLNRLADGYTTLNTKGGSVFLRRAVVVVVSNFSITDVYKNTSDEILDTLYNRFTQYDLSINTPRFPTYSIK